MYRKGRLAEKSLNYQFKGELWHSEKLDYFFSQPDMLDMDTSNNVDEVPLVLPGAKQQKNIDDLITQRH
ncbi:hypothetical protein HY492_02880 [Candidatus Woesearchaeota archaeon]|nr:hypothetical protein [Candidatus Woesearchaeota archaeon]